MKTRTRIAALSLLALTALGTVALAQAGPGRWGQRGERWRAVAQRGEHRQEIRARLRQGRELLRELQITDAQRALALQEARAVEPIARAARREALRIRMEARDANRTGDQEQVRAQVRDQIQALRERTRAELLPHGRVLVGSLTPEQRAKLEARAKEHGRTFDEQKLAQRLGRWLARPRTLDWLEVRAGR